MKKIALCISFLLFSSNTLADIQQQREHYLKIKQLLEISNSEPTQKLVQALAKDLQDYPLMPYVQYRLTKIPSNLTLKNIHTFQAQYPNFPFNADLNKLWQSQFLQPQTKRSDNSSLEIQNLTQNPKTLPQFVKNQVNTPQNSQAVYNAFFSFVKNLKEEKLANSHSPFAIYQNWAEKFSLSEKQIQKWKSALVWQLFDSNNPNIQRWRDQQISELKEDRYTERRLRLAIRQQENLTLLLALLSPEAQNKDEWQFWLAKTYAKQGNRQKTQQILTALSQHLGFYPLLAAQELGIKYQPKIRQFKQGNTASISQRFQTELARIHELRYLGENVNANREWKALLDRTNFQDKLVLSQYAQENQWFDLGVEATIQAKAWDYIALRLPNAYMNWFDLHLKNRQISRTFAMAITRQESAWHTDASSPANARGLMQLLPSTAMLTAQQFDLPYNRDNQLFEPFNNIMLGTAHLQALYDRFGDNRILIAAAYNAGSNRVEQWLQQSNGKLSLAEFVASIPFYETRGYVQNVVVYDYYYQLLQNKPLQKFSKAEYDRLY